MGRIVSIVMEDRPPETRSSKPAPAESPHAIDVWACVVVAVGILWLLTYPFDFGTAVITPWLAENQAHTLNGMANVILFTPLGAAIAFANWRRQRSRTAAVVIAVVVGVAVSFVGETLQVFLPGRISSWLDLGNNSAGALVGAIGGWRSAPTVADRLDRFTHWVRGRPLARRALVVAALLLLARTAPFDLSPETRELGEGWARSKAAVASQGQALEALAHGRLAELPWWVLADVAIFAIAATMLGRAFRESLERTGDRTNPALFVVIIGVLAATMTEAMQWPIRSRVMDPADWLGCVAGVVVGVVIDQAMGRLRRS